MIFLSWLTLTYCCLIQTQDTSTMTIDTSDKQYQVSEKFPPDKESTWTHPPEEDGWTHSHNALRNDLRMVKECLQVMQSRGESLKEWEIKLFQTACAGHVEHIQAHHSNEDKSFVPQLKTRFHYPNKLEIDHRSLEQHLKEIKGIVQGYKPGDKVDDLLKAWVAYEDHMVPHLKEEEEVGLPLMRAYFTPNEIRVLIRKLIKLSPRFEMGSMIHTMGVDKFRNRFMPQEQIPFFIWHVDFSAKYEYYKREFVVNIQALKEGKLPNTASSNFVSR